MNWLWDRKITEVQAKKILKSPENPRFIELSALLLARSNSPSEVFTKYLSALHFCTNWTRIKKQMRKNKWQEPRIIYWEAVYEKVREKLKNKGLLGKRKVSITPDSFLTTIGSKIKELRKKKNLTQRELAQKLFVSQQLVSRIEKGKENISIKHLKKIIEVLGEELKISMSNDNFTLTQSLSRQGRG